ncbi:MAG: DUF5667 domain-containing protein [Chloroflexota bacterium]|nr:DUF5667 domain-containing protein [Chloroflexota bacterium]
MTDAVTSITEELDPGLAAVLQRAFLRPVDVETAARHLWTINQEGTRIREVGTAPRRFRKAAIAALTSALLVGSSSAAVAASGPALPGDFLYSVKLGAEQARLIIALSPEADARVHLDIARQRMAEARRAAIVRPELVDQLVADALGELDAAVLLGSAEMAGEVAEVRTEAVQTVEDLDVTLDAAATALLVPALPAPSPDVVEPPEVPAVPPVSLPEPIVETGTAGGDPSPAPAPEPTPSAAPEEEPPPAEPTQRPSEPVVAPPPPAPSPSPSAAPSPSPSSSPTARPTPASSAPTFQGLDPSPSPSPSESPSPSPTPSEMPTG